MRAAARAAGATAGASRCRIALLAVTAALLPALAGCSGRDAGTVDGWRTDSSCPSPAAISAASEIPGLRFAVPSDSHDDPDRAGCAYLGPGVSLDLDSVPGPPGDVRFGTAAGVTSTKRPGLGAGSVVATSPTFCTLVVPGSSSSTLQLQLDATRAETVRHACSALPAILRVFARRDGG